MFAWLITSWDCAARFRFSDDVNAAVRVVELRLRDQTLREQLLRALVVPAGKLDVGTLGLDDVLLESRLGPGERRASGLKIRFRSAERGLQLLLVELSQHGPGFDFAVDVDGQRFDDPVGFRFDLDFRHRLDLAGGDH